MTDTSNLSNSESNDPFANGVSFAFNFGPTVARVLQGDLDDSRELSIPEIPAKAPLWASVWFQHETISQDDMDELIKACRIETVSVLADLTEYMKSGEFLDIFFGHLVTAVATYRGTVLKKGTQNRESRRRDVRTPDEKIQEALEATAPKTVTLSVEEYQALVTLAESAVTNPLDDVQEDFANNVAKDVSLKEFRVDL